MQGKIIKGIAGFYYIETHDARIYECKAKGIFRKDNVKPLVGDNVMIDIIDEENKKGNITEILPRKNRLLRPPVANVDQAVILFAIVKPNPNYNLLDKFLITIMLKGKFREVFTLFKHMSGLGSYYPVFTIRHLRIVGS